MSLSNKYIDASQLKHLTEGAADAIFHADDYEDDRLVVYVTRGLTLMVASPHMWNDDDEDHDLVAVNRFGVASACTALVMEEFVAEVQAVVDASRALDRLIEERKNERDVVRREQPEPDSESARRVAVAKKDREAYGLPDRDAPREDRSS